VYLHHETKLQELTLRGYVIVAKAKSKTKKSTIPSNVKNKALYSRVKSEAKRKFDVYPSAYANAWLVKTYKKRGGTYA